MNDQVKAEVHQSSNELQKKKRGCVFWLLIGIGIIITLGVIGSLLPKPSPEETARIEAEAKQADKKESEKQKQEAIAERANATKVTAAELSKAYEGKGF